MTMDHQEIGGGRGFVSPSGSLVEKARKYVALCDGSFPPDNIEPPRALLSGDACRWPRALTERPGSECQHRGKVPLTSGVLESPQREQAAAVLGLYDLCNATAEPYAESDSSARNLFFGQEYRPGIAAVAHALALSSHSQLSALLSVLIWTPRIGLIPTVPDLWAPSSDPSAAPPRPPTAGRKKTSARKAHHQRVEAWEAAFPPPDWQPPSSRETPSEAEILRTLSGLPPDQNHPVYIIFMNCALGLLDWLGRSGCSALWDRLVGHPWFPALAERLLSFTARDPDCLYIRLASTEWASSRPQVHPDKPGHSRAYPYPREGRHPICSCGVTMKPTGTKQDPMKPVERLSHLSLCALQGACALSKGGQEAVRAAVERSGRLPAGMKDDMLRLMDEEGWEYAGRCICMADKPVKLCAGCKGAGFCSTACQKKYWPIHKRFCKELQAEVGGRNHH